MKNQEAMKVKQTISDVEEMRKAYLAANIDVGQLEAMNEWKDTIEDGLEKGRKHN